MAALAGCGAGPLGGDGTIRYWNLFSGADGELMRQMIADVEPSLSGVDVENVTLAWGSPYYTKLAMTSAGGRSPELAIMHLTRMPGYAPGGLLDPWDTDRLADLGITGDTIALPAWQRAQQGGQQYGVPLDTHPFVLFYNTDICDQAGLLDGSGALVPLDDPQAFADAGRAIAEVTGQTGIAFGYVADTAQCWRLFYGLYCQAAPEIDLSGRGPQMDDGVATQVVEYMASITDGTVVARADDYVGGLSRFTSGGAGMILSGEWELPGFQAAGVPVGAAPIPAIFGEPTAYADSHTFVLPHQDVPDEDLRAATYDFVAGMLEDTMTWATAGHIPTYQPVVTSPEYADLQPQSSYAQAADFAVFDPPAWFTGSGTDFQNQMCQAMQSALSGDTEPAAVVADMRSRMQALMDQQAPV